MTARARGRIAIGVATGLLVLLPLAGAAGGGYAASERTKPPERACGMYAYISLTAIGSGALLGLAAGIGTGCLIARGLFRWANGCGLGDIRDDG